MKNAPRLRKSALAASIAVLLGLVGSNANALSLGRITVMSALGQNLRAEIEVPEINAEEAETLKGSVASAEAFKSAGFDYNPALNNLTVTLQKRPDGRSFLVLSGNRIVNDPFIDLILEASWASGRVLRDYTLLFDPPSQRSNATIAPTTAQVTPAVTAPAGPQGVNARQTPPAGTTREPVAVTGKTPAQRSVTPNAALPVTPPKQAAAAGQVTVRPGDTASKIAGAHKASNVSLDQMLVAMLRSNPDAFTANNINRLKSGAVLDMPSADQAGETPREEATRTVLAQSQDFNEFRRQLAAAAPAAAVSTSSRQASGKVQAKVEDKKPAATAPDRLTLSKAAQAKAADDKLAAERQAKENAARAAELSRNIADLNKVKAGASAPVAPAKAAAVPPAAPASTRSLAPAIPVPAAASAPPKVAPPAASAPTAQPTLPVTSPVTPTIASAPAVAPPPPPPKVTASTPAASAPAAAKIAPKPSAPKVEEPGLIDDMIENPLLPAGGVGLVAILAGFLVFRSRKNRKSGAGDSSFLDSHLQPDSFFGASGGEQVDTSNEPAASGSSMMYSPSQLDAAGDVDPVAEADVYLAYGRDQQAEDILKDALQATPSRIAIHSKLADIYTKRADLAAFSVVASAAHAVSQGQGTEWDHIRDLGRELDPGNSLYQQGGSTVAMSDIATVKIEPDEVPSGFKPSDSVDLDLDFDLGFDAKAAPSEPEHEEPPSVMGVLHEADPSKVVDPLTVTSEPIPLYDAPLDFAPAASSNAPSLGAPSGESDSNVLALPDISAFSEPPAPLKIKSQVATGAAAPAPTPAPADMLSFDLGALSLDLEPSPTTATKAAELDTDTLDPLSTKLALAKEFQSIGDTDGAHALAEEVYSQASGELKADAKRFLTDLGFSKSGF